MLGDGRHGIAASRGAAGSAINEARGSEWFAAWGVGCDGCELDVHLFEQGLAAERDGVLSYRCAGLKRPLASRRSACYILSHMVQYNNARLDASFAALSDATRRGVLEQLGRADASITDLAERFRMTLTGIKKHVGVLEQAGLVITEKVGRVRTCRLGPRRLEEETAWIERHHQLWDSRFDQLDKVVEELKQKEKTNERNKNK